MSNISIDFLGFTLKNPLMLTEGPLSGSFELIEKASKFEIGMIFTKGIRPEHIKSPVPYIRKYERSLINADWSDIGFKEWIRTINSLQIDTPIVTSIAKNYVNPDTAVEMAVELVKAGSKIVSFVDYDPAQLVETVKKARPLIKVPIMVKLPPFLLNLEEALKNLVSAGVDAIAAMDSIGPVLSIDIKTGEPVMGSKDGSAYLSGKCILPVTLKYIYEISRFVDVPVVGVGGVTDYKSAIQMIMAGATGVGMVTAPLLGGFDVFNKVVFGIKEYIKERGLEKVGELRGLTHRRVKERDTFINLKAGINQAKCTSCGLCDRVCYSNAIIIEDEKYQIVKEKCVGCGLCASVCSSNSITFNGKV
ncbi:MAG TPA: hypothetical protein DCK79_03635 [Candidatus Atribacteria bacterium]|jgi:dihydroorotate dehydrogenase|nr:hypothetical protein [Candidatus Atribacteria bacterium]